MKTENFIFWSIFATVGAVLFALNDTIPQVLELEKNAPELLNRHENKPFHNPDEFFPFYMQEHSDPMCRNMHYIGTTFLIFFCLMQPKLILCIATAWVWGMVIHPFTISFSHGYIEFASVIIIYLISSKLLTDSYKKGLMIPFTAYFFAWIGHFFFEHNMPATFIYPTYSLMSDFRMYAIWIQSFIP